MCQGFIQLSNEALLFILMKSCKHKKSEVEQLQKGKIKSTIGTTSRSRGHTHQFHSMKEGAITEQPHSGCGEGVGGVQGREEASGGEG